MDNKNGIDKVVIIGLGLIGGSIAKSLKRICPEIKIYALEKNIESCIKSQADKTVDIAFGEISSEFLDIVKCADIVFLCTEFNVCGGILKSIYDVMNKSIILTDVCSTKTNIIQLIDEMDRENKLNYIGGHPMAGSEKWGYENSGEFLLENAIYILCPGKDTEEEHLNSLTNIIKSMGALPYIMGHAEHDEAMARISHIPHLVASALVNTANKYDNDEMLRTLAAGGFKDITRIASGDPCLWKDISLLNKNNIIETLEELINMLNALKDDISGEKKSDIYNFLKDARDYRETFETGRKAIMNLMYELTLDVPDKPGIIADISLKLLGNNINIKNIYIAESRENELGCLRIAFDTKEARDKAKKILEA